MNYWKINEFLETETYIGREVFNGAEQGISVAFIPMTVEPENSTEKEIAEVIGQ